MPLTADKCVKCPDLFRVNAFNKVLFCNGTIGKFIDSYSGREELLADFKNSSNRKCLKSQGKAVSYSIKKEHRFCRLVEENKGFPNWFASRIFCFPVYACNNDCRHCFNDKKSQKKPLTLEQSISLVKRYSDRFDRLHIGGGEPTLFKKLFDLIAFAKKKGLQVTLLTNARRLKDVQYSRDLASAGLDVVIVPVHGDTEDIHDAITGRKGSFSQTLSGISNIIKSGVKHVNVMMVVHRRNYLRLVSATNLFAHVGVPVISFESILYEGNALKNLKELKIRVSETVPFIQEAFDTADKNNMLSYTCSHPLCLFKSKYWDRFCNERFAVVYTNLQHFDFSRIRAKFQPAGTSLFQDCIDCDLKSFCPGLWNSYFNIFGSKELKPLKLPLSGFLAHAGPDIMRKIFNQGCLEPNTLR